MLRRGEPTKARILDAAYRLIYARGFARVGVDDIAASAGVTKKTLYYHFESKDALLASLLERQSVLALDRIRVAAMSRQGSARSFVADLFQELGAWSQKKRWTGPGFTRLALELADLPGHPARTAARRHKEAVERLLAEELAKRGLDASRAAARRIQILLEGAMVLTLIHSDRAYITAAAETALATLGH